MALHKRVKLGGSFYKGYELLVSSGAGSYALDVKETKAAAVNSVAVTPDGYGAGDKFKIEHMNATTDKTLVLMSDTIYNPGAHISTLFDFPALEMMGANDVLRFTYVNTASEAMAVHLIVEYVGITKTA